MHQRGVLVAIRNPNEFDIMFTGNASACHGYRESLKLESFCFRCPTAINSLLKCVYEAINKPYNASREHGKCLITVRWLTLVLFEFTNSDAMWLRYKQHKFTDRRPDSNLVDNSMCVSSGKFVRKCLSMRSVQLSLDYTSWIIGETTSERDWLSWLSDGLFI